MNAYHKRFRVKEELCDESGNIVVDVDMMYHPLSKWLNGGQGLKEGPTTKHRTVKLQIHEARSNLSSNNNYIQITHFSKTLHKFTECRLKV